MVLPEDFLKIVSGSILLSKLNLIYFFLYLSLLFDPNIFFRFIFMTFRTFEDLTVACFCGKEAKLG